MGEIAMHLFKWIIFLCVLSWFSNSSTNGISSTSKHLSEIRKRMNYYKKHAVKSIQSEDGDIIDCIDIYKQPAFDHPALRNHIIQMSPSDETTMDSKAVSNKSTMDEKPNKMLTSQVWRKNGSCPIGTIPIRRILEKQIRNHRLSEEYGRKGPSFPYQIKKPNDNGDSNNINVNRSLAILHTEGLNYNAAKADVKVWKPYVEHDDEYSTSRIALKTGPYYEYDSIEAGCIVNPSVYGDREVRIYIYWTIDGSKTTGCFDLICPGFVQTSNEIALGGVLRSIPVPGGIPWIMTLYMHKDVETNNWWVQYQEDINIGYWPADVLKGLSVTAETVQWGGEVYSSRIGHPGHTRTEMGSGELGAPDPRSGWTKRMRVRDNSMVLKYPDWVTRYSDDYDCYPTYFLWEYMVDPEFYFGGPGKGWESWRCT
ncbi:protein neprosin-like [Silene latifolia]|uniref:protein neprosin-like n=1 Tax=Silene latifolia TaxID=37657 RepID=UPI003D778991